jgi:hypothetical protein
MTEDLTQRGMEIFTGSYILPIRSYVLQLEYILLYFTTRSPDLLSSMAKERKTARQGKGLGKQAQSFRLTPESVRKLGVAARQYGASKAVYVEIALKAQFKKDDIK